MKRLIQTQHEVVAPLEKVWSKIAQGDKVESWIPIIKSSRIEGGNKRFCEMHEGGPLEETYLISDVNKTFMYSIDHQEAFPAKNIVGSIRLEKNSENTTRLFWDLELEVENDEVFNELHTQISQIYEMSAARLSEVA